MKLEFIADLLKKDATELVSTLNLQDVQDEVPENALKDLISNHIKEVEINAKVLGKKEGEGMAKRTILTDAEKKLKTSFEVDGKDFDDILSNLNAKFETLSKSGSKDEDLKKQVDTWKNTVKDLQSKLESKDKEFESIRTKEVVKNKILPVMGKFDFATPKVQEIALNQFLETNAFKIEGDDLFLEKDGKYFSNALELAENHFKDFGKPKENKGPNAPNTRNGLNGNANTLKDLLAEVNKAKTSEERQSIMARIEALEKV